MTAVVFLKKSYQLSQAREGLGYIAAEDLGEREALRSSPFTSPKLGPRQLTLALLKARDEAPPPALPPMPDVPEDEGESENPAKAAVVPGTVPEWGSRFWSKYGNRSRVGHFGHMLYIGKMAGERMPEEAGDGKTQNLGAEMLEELARKTPDEPEDKGPEEEVERSMSS